MEEFLKPFKLSNSTNEKPTHTSMTPTKVGGKWKVPETKLIDFYNLVNQDVIDKKKSYQIVERMEDNFPLPFDFDMKYKSVINERQYSDTTIQKIINYLNSEIKECLEISESNGNLIVMEKAKPYPCNKSGFQSKDGLHLMYPSLIVSKEAFKKIIQRIQNSGMITKIFQETCEIPPDNTDKEIVDSSFSSWQLYGCGKKMESPYMVTKVYRMDSNFQACEIESSIFQKYYQDPVELMKMMSMCYRKNDNVVYKEELVKTLKQKKLSISSPTMTNDDDIYGDKFYVDNNNIINPYKIVEEEELKLVKALIQCLSKNRSEEYGKWLSVGLCLHNINPSLLEDWEAFSNLYDRYKDGTSKRDCSKKWESFNNDHSGERLGIGSLMFWAKNDNEKDYTKAKNASLSTFVDKSIKNGSEADYLVAQVIYQRYKDEFISVNVKDEWYHFNGVRWQRTLEGTILKTRVHNEIYNLYTEYEEIYRDKKEAAIAAAEDDDEKQDIRDGKTKEGRWMKNVLSIKMKLLQGNYVKGIMNNLRDLFYKKEIMEQFDTDNNLLGFENGIYDLKNNMFREGRPEDYVTLSTKISLPVEEADMPIPLDELSDYFEDNIDNYNRYYVDLKDFIEKIVPNEAVREYTLKFLGKCLHGDNRDEGFYMWTGTGGNGKSKLIDLMSLCLGEYACNLPVALLTQKRKASGAASPEMAVTKGKRLAVMQEPDVNETLNIGQMKEMTGNDKIQARGLYKEPFEFTPQFKLLMMCNDLPNVPSNDDGTWRRLEVVDFKARFVDEQKDVDPSKHRHIKDKRIKNKIPMWVIPFYSILLPTWRDYDKNGITIPDEVKAKTRDYRNNNDLVGRWIVLKCEEADNEKAADGVTEYAPTDFETLYSEFSDWCKDEEFLNRPDKSGVREALKKWQEKSKYGLLYGKYKSDKKPNGYESCMKFNLRLIE